MQLQHNYFGPIRTSSLSSGSPIAAVYTGDSSHLWRDFSYPLPLQQCFILRKEMKSWILPNKYIFLLAQKLLRQVHHYPVWDRRPHMTTTIAGKKLLSEGEEKP